MHWNAITRKELNQRIDHALGENASYSKAEVIGTPATYLDQKEFYPDASFLKHAPFLRTLIANPNHIGCHTLGKNSSPIFKGTQAIEKELISLCAEEIFAAPKNQIDGYVATGGTEANIEALWIYRNYFIKEYRAKPNQIGVLFSEDTHYSITKACDLLLLPPLQLTVSGEDRQIDRSHLQEQLEKAKSEGIKYFIVILNLSTTMFGSVDEIDPVVQLLDQHKLVFKLHLDAAFGGFIYPFTNPNSTHNFSNKRISSISIDAHKMLQTPYGTGIFLIKKGYMQYVTNTNAQYVPGLDYTLCGSRSGANAVVIWMLLMNYGSEGWTKKMQELIERTDYLCQQLTELGIEFYRNPSLNIVTIKANQISSEIAAKFELVADSYEKHPFWWKIVVMDHVNYSVLDKFLKKLKESTAEEIN
ncbi:MAG: aspartate aminotransferase family protein [Flavobacteriales bacterium]|nr:aspartate aminotransferase family protein [Flavobacteriales bacterium]